MPETAAAKPSSGVVSLARVVAQMKRAVSMPSRATETKPTAATPHPLPSRARSIWERSSPPMPRDIFSIQKTIQVTMATATSERRPPMASCAVKERP
jgi:hypothetical protein